jgi:hypothetical protein
MTPSPGPYLVHPAQQGIAFQYLPVSLFHHPVYLDPGSDFMEVVEDRESVDHISQG